jgi:HEAT repeat protein
MEALQKVLGGPHAPGPGEERVLANAISALRFLGEGTDLALVQPLLEAEDPRVRANAIELVEERVEIPSILPALERSFSKGAPREHANAAVALWRRGSVEALSRLVHEVDSPGENLAPSAAFGLGRMGGTVAEQALTRALRSGGDATRRIAFRFLSKAA